MLLICALLYQVWLVHLRSAPMVNNEHPLLFVLGELTKRSIPVEALILQRIERSSKTTLRAFYNAKRRK